LLGLNNKKSIDFCSIIWHFSYKNARKTWEKSNNLLLIAVVIKYSLLKMAAVTSPKPEAEVVQNLQFIATNGFTGFYEILHSDAHFPSKPDMELAHLGHLSCLGHRVTASSL